jgi:primosomal protein N' (replication factor Y)
MVSITGATDALVDFRGQVATQVRRAGIEVGDPLGPVPLEEGRQRWLYQLEHRDGAAFAAALREVQGTRARGRQPVVTVRVDPLDID